MQRAPKQWCLTKNESVNSFENWRQNLTYTLSLDPNFAPFLILGASWEKLNRDSPLRGFVDDANDIPVGERKTAQQKCNMLQLMLGQIANYCPVISRNSLVKTSTSIESIWQTIRLHFGFQTTGAHFLDLADIRLGAEERPEDLYQRLMAFVEDSLLSGNCISHHGDILTEDEELSPTLENFIVLTWLRLIHSDLPKLIKQRYGTELRSRTLSSIKPEISQALDSLLDEIRSSEDAKVMRTATSLFRKSTPSSRQQTQRFQQRERCCPLCKQAGRTEFRHFLSSCRFLPENDRKFMTKARQIVGIIDNEQTNDVDFTETTCCDDVDPIDSTSHPTFRIQVRQSPYVDVFFHHHSARITIDSGATGNMIRLSTVKRLGAVILKSSQSAHQADGSSPLKVIGETKLMFVRGGKSFSFDGLIVENLDVEILAGTPFMESNDIAVRPAKRQVILGDGTTYLYGSIGKPTDSHSIRRMHVLRVPVSTTVWPGEFVEVDLPGDIPSDCDYALEPRIDSPVNKHTSKDSRQWPPPSIVSSVAGKIRIPNLFSEPLHLKRNEHFCQARPVFTPSCEHETGVTSHTTIHSHAKHTDYVKLDPDNVLCVDTRANFRSLLNEYDSVFDPKVKGYNGHVGPFESKVNMGPVEPPQRKGRLPQYARDKLVELQQKFDDLEEIGVFKRPEDVGVSVEYLNPSFLVKKASGGYRLVTAFSDVGRYSKPQPSLMPDVDSTLRLIAQWKYIVSTDLTNAFYQIPLSRDSMRYCGVVTPFSGVRVYVRSAMGMPGSETALEELMCRVLGSFLREGIVAKIADDLYCGGNTEAELLHNWRRVLHALYECDLCLSASKTVICPKTTTILGWVWNLGTIRASTHRIATLSSCNAPEKVGGLRSFIGAYKVLARVLPNCSTLLAPLDDAVAGRQTNETVVWSDDLHMAFAAAQTALSTNCQITLPRPTDHLWIVTDGAVKKPGIGATLYVTRSGKLHLAGFFSAKLRGRQVSWLPCEVEALSIAVATKHFSPYIVQSNNNACVLTDSKPCVQAFEKLCRGEFSASPRVSTFLSTVSRYQALVRHVSGSAILPSDFASRNAVACEDLACQVCNFVNRTEESVVRRTSTQDILAGTSRLPFTSRTSWLAIQSECPDLRRTRAHLHQGTRPSKKLANIRDVKRYLNATTIAKDGLLVVCRNEPLAPCRESIVVPRQVLDGLLMALHLKLDHPSKHQMKLVVRRYFFALDMDKNIDGVCDGCHQCAALLQSPHTLIEQTTSEPPDVIGTSFAADVLKGSRQLVLVVRECVTSYTLAIGDFTVTSFAVSRGHPAPLVGKRLLAGGLRVYFCLDSCLVYINFAHTQDHDYVLYLCGGTSGVVWTACFSLLSSKKMENEENSG